MLLLLVIICGSSVAVPAKVAVEEVAKSLPRELSGFSLSGPITGLSGQELIDAGNEHVLASALVAKPDRFERFAVVGANYLSADGESFFVQLVRVERDSDAYSWLTLFAQRARASEPAART